MKMFRGKNPFYSICGTSAINDFQSAKSGPVTPYYKHLSFNPTFYNWILVKFSENSEVANFAFNDILETRISFDLCQNSKEISSCKFIEVSTIFKVYCNARNFFLASHLEFLKKVSHEDILYPLFEYYLLDLFQLPPLLICQCKLQIISMFTLNLKEKGKKGQ
ncbi:42742_t:CDS:1 [Gigaspora margarita]|uniref:42742_t:CDS:1 n=1 Tax=Gigaspora margarita TaxID=4874 RepID=A0ABN7VI22_GIGMA|nr:42742_t:CDS:1 [Gigaspora margarita]